MANDLDAQLERLYDQLRRMASKLLAHEQSAKTLQATLVVDDAFFKLSKKQMSDGEFLAKASEAMRQVIIDHIRTKDAQKRGGPGRAHVPADKEVPSHLRSTRKDIQKENLERIYTVLVEPQYDGVGASELVIVEEQAELLHEGMRELYQDDPPAARVVDMKIFGGLSLQQIAVATGTPKGTVKGQYDRGLKTLRDNLTEKP